MSSCSNKDQLKYIPPYLVNQKPIRFNMTLSTPTIVSSKRMIFILRFKLST